MPAWHPAPIKTTYDEAEPRDVYTKQMNGTWAKSEANSPKRSSSTKQQRGIVGQSIMKSTASPSSSIKRSQSTLKVNRTTAINNYYKNKVSMQRRTDQLFTS